jgi:hypothetical protein
MTEGSSKVFVFYPEKYLFEDRQRPLANGSIRDRLKWIIETGDVLNHSTDGEQLILNSLNRFFGVR